MDEHTLLMDMVDQRLPLPQYKTAEGIIHIAQLAHACLSGNPQSRPTMKQVSSHLMDKWNPLTKPFSEVKLGEIFPFFPTRIQ